MLPSSAPSYSPGTPTNAHYKPLPLPPQATPPLVLVEGFLSYTSEYFWGDFETHLNAHRAQVGSKKSRHIIFARVSPVNSVHDRACELYYSLKGGTVDYGEDHSIQSGHSRYGRHHSIGLYPSWSAKHPLHFLGHSIGGVAIVKMMGMIRGGFFGPDAHPDMVATLNSVGSPFRGTQIGYWVTGSYTTAPKFGPFALSTFLSWYLHLVSYFSPILPSAIVPDLHNESRKLSMKDMSFPNLLRQLWSSDWSEGKDAIPWDCTFQAGEDRDAEWERFHGVGGRTWYRSYATSWTQLSNPEEPFHVPKISRMFTATPLWILSWIIGRFDFRKIRPIPKFLGDRLSTSFEEEDEGYLSDEFNTLDDPEGGVFPSSKTPSEQDGLADENPKPVLLGEQYFANDGLIPLVSQWHPGDCDNSSCTHYAPLMDTARLPPSRLQEKSILKPGVWNVITVENTHHFSLMPLWLGSHRQRTFWYGLGEWLEEVDNARSLLSLHDAIPKMATSKMEAKFRMHMIPSAHQ